MCSCSKQERLYITTDWLKKDLFFHRFDLYTFFDANDLKGFGSCMVSHALNPVPGWKILDACAAPGNKTTHLAALMEDQGSILALDMNSTRLKHLQKTVRRSGSKIINCIKVTTRCIFPKKNPLQMDFLNVDPQSNRFKDTDAILLDPSCSGSGTAISRQDFILPSFSSQTHFSNIA